MIYLGSDPVGITRDIPNTSIIDDTAGSGDTDKVWSADKSSTELTNLTNALNDKYTKPASGIPAEDLASGVIPSVPVTDVQVEGTSILSQGVANIPYASEDALGLTATRDYFGMQAIKTGPDKGRLQTVKATDANIKTGTDNYKPIVSSNQQTAVFYGLAKASGDSTQSSSSNAVGVYTADALVKIQKMLGIYEAPWELIREDHFTNASEADHVISVDGNGDAFEITEMAMVLWFPTQANEAKNGSGRVILNNGLSSRIDLIVDTKTLAANATESVAYCFLEQKNGIVIGKSATWANSGIVNSIKLVSRGSTSDDRVPIKLTSEVGYSSITIQKITGTMYYKVYGRRKWRT